MTPLTAGTEHTSFFLQLPAKHPLGESVWDNHRTMGGLWFIPIRSLSFLKLCPPPRCFCEDKGIPKSGSSLTTASPAGMLRLEDLGLDPVLTLTCYVTVACSLSSFILTFLI